MNSIVYLCTFVYRAGNTVPVAVQPVLLAVSWMTSIKCSGCENYFKDNKSFLKHVGHRTNRFKPCALGRGTQSEWLPDGCGAAGGVRTDIIQVRPGGPGRADGGSGECCHEECTVHTIFTSTVKYKNV